MLLAGDATNDNIADIGDLLLVIAHYNAIAPSPNYLAEADFNCDNAVDISDLLLLIGNYNIIGNIYASGLLAVSTGSGKINLNWNGSTGATGYNIYRATVSGGQNYVTPVNGATPVTALSFPGSKTFTYTDTGLTNGTEHFYTVKAVNSGGESVVSNEDSDIVDSSAIPWGDAPAVVLGAVRTAYANESVALSSLRVVGPDGRVYDDNEAQIQLPDATIEPGTNTAKFVDGEQVTLSQVAFIQQLSPPTQALPNARSGPYRRVLSTDIFTGGSGIFQLPPLTNTFVAAGSGDGLCIMLGSHSTNDNKLVDAGLLYTRKADGTFSDWRPYVLTHPTTKKPPFLCFPSYSTNPVKFSPDSIVSMVYIARPTFPAPKSKGFPCLVEITEVDTGLTQSMGAYIGYRWNETVRVKRLISIAQDNTDPIVRSAGYKRTGSFLQGVNWQNGGLFGPTLPSGGNWTGPRTFRQGSFPLDTSVVSWTVIVQFSLENNISINLR